MNDYDCDYDYDYEGDVSHGRSMRLVQLMKRCGSRVTDGRGGRSSLPTPLCLCDSSMWDELSKW